MFYVNLFWAFAALLGLSFIMMFVGFFKPSLSLFWYKNKRTRLKSFGFYNAFSILIIVLMAFSSTLSSKQRKKEELGNKNQLLELKEVTKSKLSQLEIEEKILADGSASTTGETAVLLNTINGISIDSLANMSEEDKAAILAKTTKSQKFKQSFNERTKKLDTLRSDILLLRTRIKQIDSLLSN